MRQTWRTVNTLFGRSTDKTNNITLLDDNGEDVSYRKSVSNMFCDYFSTIATKLNENIPNSNTDPMKYMPPRQCQSFFASPASVAETKKMMSMPNKEFNKNSIPIFIYKKIVDFIAPLLCNLFNRSVLEGRFPAVLKIAWVTPIHKSKSPKVTSNFRPISLLFFFAKIIEKLMKVRVMAYLDKNNVIYNRQFGFRSGYSTSDAILEFVDLCASSLDQKLYTIAVFLDLSKAFDTVNKNIMLLKLERLGFRGGMNEWFDSYLSDRDMYVQRNDCSSQVKCINIGLPQGAVNSPWLFSLYVIICTDHQKN